MLRQTAYGHPPLRSWGIDIGAAVAAPLFGGSLKDARIHPVGGKVPPTAVEAKVNEGQGQVQGREPDQGIAKTTPVPPHPQAAAPVSRR